MSKPLRPLLLLLSLSLIQSYGWAESFTAKVKVTLVNPVEVAEDHAMNFGPVKAIKGGQCTMNPIDGSLSGNACISSQAEASIININGTEALNVSVNLNDSESGDIRFRPELYNGQDQQNHFKLAADMHPVNIGGTLSISDSVNYNSADLHYSVEVLYP